MFLMNLCLVATTGIGEAEVELLAIQSLGISRSLHEPFLLVNLSFCQLNQRLVHNVSASMGTLEVVTIPMIS